jgi:hypothetical protein
MKSKKITSLNPFVTSVNQKYVTAKDFNALQEDVTTLYSNKLPVSEGATIQLTAEDSGKIFFVDAATAAATYRLPVVPEVGLHFKWIWVADSGNYDQIIKTYDTTDTSGDMLRGGVLVCSAAALNTFVESTADKNTFTANNSTANAAAGIGSWVEIICVEDPIWFVTGVMNSTGDADATGSAYFTDTD